MNVFIEKENKLLELHKACTGEELLKFLNINPNVVLLIKNNEVVLLDEKLSENDDIKIMTVVSGG